MGEKFITLESIESYSNHLKCMERSENTITKYRRDIMAFLRWIGDNCILPRPAATEALSQRPPGPDSAAT